MPKLPFRLPYLPLSEASAGDDRRRRSQCVSGQVNERGDGESNKVAGDDVCSHPGNKHLRQQFPTVKQHGFDAGRNTDPHHFPDNGEVKRTEIAFKRQAQRWRNSRHQHADYRRRTNITGNGQP